MPEFAKHLPESKDEKIVKMIGLFLLLQTEWEKLLTNSAKGRKKPQLIFYAHVIVIIKFLVLVLENPMSMSHERVS